MEDEPTIRVRVLRGDADGKKSEGYFAEKELVSEADIEARVHQLRPLETRPTRYEIVEALGDGRFTFEGREYDRKSIVDAVNAATTPLTVPVLRGNKLTIDEVSERLPVENQTHLPAFSIPG